MFEEIPYQRPLVIGTGGGSDIVSATLVLSDFVFSGRNPDLAGMCSPGAWHTYNSENENPVNLVTSEARRFIPSRSKKSMSFLDSLVPSLLRNEGVNSNVYNLSGRYGTTRLINDLELLVRKEKYDGIIAVDIGGDIFARGAEDPTILSPIMDFTTLYAISQLNLPSTLIEFGLQTDGELRPRGCEEILSQLKSDGTLLDTKTILPKDRAVDFYKRIYQGTATLRHGHAAHMTLQTFEANEDIPTEYRSRVQVLDKKWHFSFPITLEAKYFGKAFVVDLKKLAQNRSRAFAYGDPLEAYIKHKRIADTKTEMDMLYSWQGNTCAWLGLLCPQITGEQRKEVLSYGLNRLEEHADVALLRARDAAILPKRKHTIDLSEFTLTGDSRDSVEKLALIIGKAGEII